MAMRQRELTHLIFATALVSATIGFGRWRLTSSTGATYFASGSDGEGAAPSYSAAVETLRCYTSDIAASCAERSSGDRSRSRSTKLQRQPFQATTTTAAPMTHHAPYSAMDSELLRAAVEELLDVSREMSGTVCWFGEFIDRSLDRCSTTTTTTHHRLGLGL